MRSIRNEIIRWSILGLAWVSALGLVAMGDGVMAADDRSESMKERLKAKNSPGYNWEGPHVPELMNIKDWEQVLAKSKKGPVFVFKHSTTCGISASAAYRVNKWLEDAPESTPEFYFVIVRSRRPVSNAIEGKLQVKHESPQLLLIRDEKSLWDTDHGAITSSSIEEALKTHIGQVPPDSTSPEGSEDTK